MFYIQTIAQPIYYLMRSYKMNNITVYENSIGQPMVSINNGDSITYMSESDYNEMIAAQASLEA